METGVGTATYVSPEQLEMRVFNAKGNKSSESKKLNCVESTNESVSNAKSLSTYGSKTDIYSLGIILLELLYPTQTSMERARIIQNVRQNPPQLPEGLEKTHRVLCDLIRQMCDHDPDRRPSASDLCK